MALDGGRADGSKAHTSKQARGVRRGRGCDLTQRQGEQRRARSRCSCARPHVVRGRCWPRPGGALDHRQPRGGRDSTHRSRRSRRSCRRHRRSWTLISPASSLRSRWMQSPSTLWNSSVRDCARARVGRMKSSLITIIKEKRPPKLTCRANVRGVCGQLGRCFFAARPAGHDARAGRGSASAGGAPLGDRHCAPNAEAHVAAQPSQAQAETRLPPVRAPAPCESTRSTPGVFFFSPRSAPYVRACVMHCVSRAPCHVRTAGA